MSTKTYAVTVTLPDLSAAHAEQEAKAEATSWPLALKRACEEICQRRHVRGRHIKSAKIYLSVLAVEEKKSEKRARNLDTSEQESFEQASLFDL